jgi:hypothetical protein
MQLLPLLARELFGFRRASIGTDERLDMMRNAVQGDVLLLH